MMRFIHIALEQVGVKETYGPNLGPEIQKYQAATTLAPGAWPYCAAGVAWCLRERILEGGFQPYLDAKRKAGGTLEPDDWRYRGGTAAGLEIWGAMHGTVQRAELPVHPGDIITYDFEGRGVADHCGIAVADNHDSLSVVEFNTSDPNGPAGNERNGDGVYMKFRPRHLARRVIRLVP
jgi:hypothetical protein